MEGVLTLFWHTTPANVVMLTSKKQRIQKTPSTPSINFTFGLTLIPRAQKTKAEKAVETAVSTAKKNEAQSALKVEAETVVSSPASPKPLEAETVVCPASPKPLEAETDVSLPASPKPLEAETDVSLPASPKPLEAETVVSPPASPKPLEAETVVSPPASPKPLEAETVVSPPASPVPQVETIESTAVSTETQSTEPSKVDLTSASGMQIDLTKDVILQVPELELHRIMDEKEMQEYLLEETQLSPLQEALEMQEETQLFPLPEALEMQAETRLSLLPEALEMQADTRHVSASRGFARCRHTTVSASRGLWQDAEQDTNCPLLPLSVQTGLHFS
uniref:Uncharacterized protein n=1 Tax=Seriola dumerili TaxID=41447 RepID=A0A3B4V1Z1_SERDU